MHLHTHASAYTCVYVGTYPMYRQSPPRLNTPVKAASMPRIPFAPSTTMRSVVVKSQPRLRMGSASPLGDQPPRSPGGHRQHLGSVDSEDAVLSKRRLRWLGKPQTRATNFPSSPASCPAVGSSNLSSLVQRRDRGDATEKTPSPARSSERSGAVESTAKGDLEGRADLNTRAPSWLIKPDVWP